MRILRVKFASALVVDADTESASVLVPLKYLINRWEDYEQLVKYASQSPIFALDTETNASRNSKFELQLVGASFGFDDFAAYVPFRHIWNDTTQINPIKAMDLLRPILENPEQEIVMHNRKYDETVFLTENINTQAKVHDTLVMCWLNDEKSTKALKPNVLRYHRYPMQTYEEVIDAKKKSTRDYSFARVSVEDAISYAGDDAYFTLKLFHHLKALLEKQGIWQAYDRIERPLIGVVRDMEWAGVQIDRNAIDHANEELPKIANRLEADIYQVAGQVFNIKSGKQLGPIIQDICKIKLPRTPKGQLQTGEKILKPYKDRFPMIADVLRYKKITKTHGSFIEGMYRFIDKDGKIHCQFLPQGTRTGRFSSKEPNFQQLTMDGVEDIRVRDYIIASPGRVLVQSDYSQIELRVMAHLAKDKKAIQAFLDGMDFHDAAARQVFHLLAQDEVSARQRFQAKGINFGVPYGRGPNSIAQMFGGVALCGYWRTKGTSGEPCNDCAKCLIEEWFKQFPGIRVLKEKTIKEARQRGYVRTLAGRKRRLLPEIRSSDWKLRGGAERQAFNTVIQGSAADIIKLAMVQMHPKLLDCGANLVITCHDELLVDCPISEQENVSNIIKHTMEHPLDGKNPLIVPLLSEPKIVSRWSDAK